MYLIRWHHVLPFGAMMACAASLAHAQAPAQSDVDTRYHLHGSVVDGLTGKPISRALVTSTDRRLATLTNAEGQFSVDLSVPPAAASRRSSGFGMSTLSNGGSALQLVAQRPGFLPDTQPASVALDDSLNSKEIVLQLMPGATIVGHVTAAGADSTRGVQVSLLRRQVVDGLLTWTQAGSHPVNAEGVFRFTQLEPGEYTVMSAEWTGNPASAIDFSQTSAQYPPDFLGDTASFEGATKLHVHAGDELTAALHLHTATYYPVVVPVQNQPQGSPVNVRILGANTFNGFRLGWDGKEAAVTGALPSGSYTLLVSSFGPHPAATIVPLTVAGHGLQHAPVTLAPGGDLPVRVHLEFSVASNSNTGALAVGGVTGLLNGTNLQGAPLGQAQLNLSLRPEDTGGGLGALGMRTREDGSAVIENAAPGRYVVRANAFRGYIASLSSGNVDLLRNPLVVTGNGSADPIDVTLRDDGATIKGTVDGAGDMSLGPTSLLLLPADGSMQMNQGYAAGSPAFTISNIAPGTYRLLALNAVRAQNQIPYRDPEAMKAYNSKGVLVTLSAGETSAVHVPLTDLNEITKRP